MVLTIKNSLLQAISRSLVSYHFSIFQLFVIIQKSGPSLRGVWICSRLQHLLVHVLHLEKLAVTFSQSKKRPQLCCLLLRNCLLSLTSMEIYSQMLSHGWHFEKGQRRSAKWIPRESNDRRSNAIWIFSNSTIEQGGHGPSIMWLYAFFASLIKDLHKYGGF